MFTIESVRVTLSNSDYTDIRVIYSGGYTRFETPYTEIKGIFDYSVQGEPTLDSVLEAYRLHLVEVSRTESGRFIHNSAVHVLWSGSVRYRFFGFVS